MRNHILHSDMTLYRVDNIALENDLKKDYGSRTKTNKGV